MRIVVWRLPWGLYEPALFESSAKANGRRGTPTEYDSRAILKLMKHANGIGCATNRTP